MYEIYVKRIECQWVCVCKLRKAVKSGHRSKLVTYAILSIDLDENRHRMFGVLRIRGDWPEPRWRIPSSAETATL